VVFIEHAAGYLEAQVPVLALCNRLWADHSTSQSLFPGEVKNSYQPFRWRLRAMPNVSETEHLPSL